MAPGRGPTSSVWRQLHGTEKLGKPELLRRSAKRPCRSTALMAPYSVDTDTQRLDRLNIEVTVNR